MGTHGDRTALFLRPFVSASKFKADGDIESTVALVTPSHCPKVEELLQKEGWKREDTTEADAGSDELVQAFEERGAKGDFAFVLYCQYIIFANLLGLMQYFYDDFLAFKRNKDREKQELDQRFAEEREF